MTTVYRISSSSELKELDAYLTLNEPVSWDIHTTLEKNLNRKANKKADAAFYVAYDKSDKPVGALAHEFEGSMRIFAPQTESIPALAAAWADNPPKETHTLGQIVGPNEHVFQLLSALNITSRGYYRRVLVEDFFFAALDEITKPANRADLTECRADIQNRPLYGQWMAEFFVEALGASNEFGTQCTAIDDVHRYMDTGSLFVLKKEGTPIGMCGIDRVAMNNLFIHSVWIDPKERRKGYAQAMIPMALDLAQADLMAKKPVQGPDPKYALLITDNRNAMDLYSRHLGMRQEGLFRRNVFYRSEMNSIISDYHENRSAAPHP